MHRARYTARDILRHGMNHWFEVETVRRTVSTHDEASTDVEIECHHRSVLGKLDRLVQNHFDSALSGARKIFSIRAARDLREDRTEKLTARCAVKIDIRLLVHAMFEFPNPQRCEQERFRPREGADCRHGRSNIAAG